MTNLSHLVAVVGGSTAGSSVAEVLSDHGCTVVVFEQNAKPYGKIEDGLPRWHDKLRSTEYQRINDRLDRPTVHFVPNTMLGRELDFQDVANWGWSAFVLANGAWQDRPLSIPGSEDAVGKGLLYQNPLIAWFNHMHEPGYAGPHYDLPDGTVVVGGGLASIDVAKIVQLQLYARALEGQGMSVDLLEMERRGIPKYLSTQGIDDPTSLGIQGALLIYRRSVGDMPLVTPPPGASPEALERLPAVRQKVLAKVQRKFLLRFQELRVPHHLEWTDGRVSHIHLQETRVQDGRVLPIEGAIHRVETSLVVSSIGSLPLPIPGIEMDGSLYAFSDLETGAYGPMEHVFATGNVVTGRGNIHVSRRHGRYVGEHLAEQYLGVSEEVPATMTEGPERGSANAQGAASAVADHLAGLEPPSSTLQESILERVKKLQNEVGYSGFARWIAEHPPS